MPRFRLHFWPGVRRQLSLAAVPQKHAGTDQIGQAQRTNHGRTVPRLRLWVILYSTLVALGLVVCLRLEAGRPRSIIRAVRMGSRRARVWMNDEIATCDRR